MCKVPIKKSFCYNNGLHMYFNDTYYHYFFGFNFFTFFFKVKLCFILSKTLNIKAKERITDSK